MASHGPLQRQGATRLEDTLASPHGTRASSQDRSEKSRRHCRDTTALDRTRKIGESLRSLGVEDGIQVVEGSGLD